jgi:hypothetical protein
MVCVPSQGTETKCDRNTSWINEAGLYKLVLKSTLKSAEVFQDWVCMEVLPSIRKAGSYSTYRYSRNQNELGTTKARTVEKSTRTRNWKRRRVTSQNKNTLNKSTPIPCFNLVSANTWPQDAYLKGCTKGQPDKTVIRKLPNGFHDVLAIELNIQTVKGSWMMIKKSTTSF